ncbi:putative Glycogen recognition site of AMP-activated protein kinase [Blattamonas nauphoetae]|uniref:Glycogen recognition site of AMP-activated protein kinase n=1 Tax=Blattamonas nauphoetae TaxID=2049346 RepID=A0ABQ9X0D5_9EUKA|nr:putative Glycogen recognition site of AMP-activated protein kinase [Blattamonas nauphoetae]
MDCVTEGGVTIYPSDSLSKRLYQGDAPGFTQNLDVIPIPGFDLIEVQFTWNHPSGDDMVYLSGTFNKWSERIPMDVIRSVANNDLDTSTSKHHPTWHATVHLPPGLHAFRFIVEGQWRINPDFPIRKDAQGNEFNAIAIKVPQSQNEELPWTVVPHQVRGNPSYLAPALTESMLNNVGPMEVDPFLLPFPQPSSAEHFYIKVNSNMSEIEQENVEATPEQDRFNNTGSTFESANDAASTDDSAANPVTTPKQSGKGVKGLSKTMPANSRSMNSTHRSSTIRSYEADESLQHTLMIDRKKRSPGPIYDISTSSKAVLPRSRVSKFGTEDRAKFMSTTRSISPGFVYKPSIAFCSNRARSPGARWSRNERTSVLIDKTQNDVLYALPKPDVISNVPRSPCSSFAKDDRNKYFVRSNPNPGPGSYNPPATVRVKKEGSKKGPWSRSTRDTTDWCF